MAHPPRPWIAWIEDTALGTLLERVGVAAAPPPAVQPRYAPERERLRLAALYTADGRVPAAVSADAARVPDALKLRRQLAPAEPAERAVLEDEIDPPSIADNAALGELWSQLHEAEQDHFKGLDDEAPSLEPDAGPAELDDAAPAGAPTVVGLPAVGLPAVEGSLDGDDLPALPPSAAEALGDALAMIADDPRVQEAFLADAEGNLLAGGAHMEGLAHLAASLLTAAHRAPTTPAEVCIRVTQDDAELIIAAVRSDLADLILGVLTPREPPGEPLEGALYVVRDALAQLSS